MPGIVGMISLKRPPEECQRLVHTMVGTLMHERFYVSGTCSAPELGMFGGWVAHPGSFAANVSAGPENEQVAIAFSGECFADRPQPRNKITAPGTGREGCDGGWLARQLREDGARCIESLNGLFSGFVIDRPRRCAYLFNDRYGIERIYLHQSDDAIWFASEAKALLSVCSQLRTFDELGVAQFLAFGCTVEWRTLFRGVELLPGGSRCSFGPDKGWRKERYFQPEAWAAQPPMPGEEFEEAFDAMFPRILKRYLVPREDLGISLTGGLDTRMIMVCLPETAPLPICYTFSGRTEQTLDGRLAARIASVRGLEHKILRIGDDFLEQYGEFVDRTVYVTDGCAGATGAHEIYLNRKARALAPIRLTGNFGSEVLRGMSTFKPRQMAGGLLGEELRRSVAEAAEQVPAAAAHPVTSAAFREVPWNLFGTLAAGRSQVTFRTPYLDNDVVGLAFRAPRARRTSPLPALRFVSRTHAALGKIPTDRGQIGEKRGPAWALRRLLAEFTFKLDYLHKEGLPQTLAPLDPLLDALSCTGMLGLHKFLPYRRWYRRELAGYLRDTLNSASVMQSPFWNADFVKQLTERHISGRNNYVSEINSILTLEAVQRLLFRGQ